MPQGQALPKGRNVILEKSFGSPRITKERCVCRQGRSKLEDKFEKHGAQMVKEVASLHQ